MNILSRLLTTCLLGLLCIISSNVKGQALKPASTGSTNDSTLLWLKDLNEAGIKVDGDSIFVSKESELLIKDDNYRKIMYPAVYTWPVAISFIQKQEIKKALWFFINLYLINDQNKELVVKSILMYDKVFKMDKVLVNSFYTYSLTDPEIGTIEEGHSKITAPHIMEKKLNALKAMLFYLDKYKPKDRKDDSTSR